MLCSLFRVFLLYFIEHTGAEAAGLTLTTTLTFSFVRINTVNLSVSVVNLLDLRWTLKGYLDMRANKMYSILVKAGNINGFCPFFAAVFASTTLSLPHFFLVCHYCSPMRRPRLVLTVLVSIRDSLSSADLSESDLTEVRFIFSHFLFAFLTRFSSKCHRTPYWISFTKAFSNILLFN